MSGSLFNNTFPQFSISTQTPFTYITFEQFPFVHHTFFVIPLFVLSPNKKLDIIYLERNNGEICSR